MFVSVAGNFHHSDCIGGGGGSAESPYNNISSAQSQRGGPPLLFTMIWPIANMMMMVTVMTIMFFCVIPINSSWEQCTFNWRATSNPDFIQNYFLIQLSLPFPPWVSTSSNPGFQDCPITGTLAERQRWVPPLLFMMIWAINVVIPCIFTKCMPIFYILLSIILIKWCILTETW